MAVNEVSFLAPAYRQMARNSSLTDLSPWTDNFYRFFSEVELKGLVQTAELSSEVTSDVLRVAE
jgi:hypothetical protein